MRCSHLSDALSCGRRLVCRKLNPQLTKGICTFTARRPHSPIGGSGFRHAVNIRKFVLRAATLHDIVELGSLPAAAARFLDASVRAGLNILVAGGTQAG